MPAAAHTNQWKYAKSHNKLKHCYHTINHMFNRQGTLVAFLSQLVISAVCFVVLFMLNI